MKKVTFLAFALVAIVLVMFQPASVSVVANEGPPVVMSATYHASVVSLPVSTVQPQEVTDPVISSGGFGDLIKASWFEILMAALTLIGIIVRLTPTKTDDTILAFLLKIINAIFPNRSKDGTVFGPQFKALKKE